MLPGAALPWQDEAVSNELSGDAPIRVVYVEDDERLARLTTQYLTSHGVEVFRVARGDQAVAEVLRVRPEVVLLDLMLPGMSGRGVFRGPPGWSSES
jgi:CheY-like chemotaxis protein